MTLRNQLRRLAEIFSIVVALWGLSCTDAQNTAQSAPQSQLIVSGKVIGGSGRHTIYVALWDAAGFLHTPVQQIQITPHGEAVFQFKVPSGVWALSSYEDINENGVLDIGTFGPKEPSGFWRPFHQWRKPRFADVSFAMDKSVANANIELHK